VTEAETAQPLRIAMWSGPRNISTAMMYSFASRADTFASDEPLYAHYLDKTGVDHPGATEVIAAGETDWREVVRSLSGEIPGGAPIWYQKHMCHHILEGMDLDWTASMSHCFLLRDPREMLLSLSKKTDAIDAWATGLPQQARLVEAVRQMTGQDPLIVDSGDLLYDPQRLLGVMCERFGIRFDPAMLSWTAGPKDCDGVWAEYWYDSVWRSTGFAAPRPRHGELSPKLEAVLSEVQPIYEALSERRLS
jgi:hypothetical protein